MYVYKRYYILGEKNKAFSFLTEDKTFTEQIEWAERFASRKDAEKRIKFHQEEERYPYYSGDFYVANHIEVTEVEIVIK